jgi:thiosulfate reductase cytochrome b subunit
MQFSVLTTFFYDFQGARLVHFLGMSAIVLFLVVHVALALLVPKTLVAMMTGGPKIDADRRDVSAKPAPSPDAA